MKGIGEFYISLFRGFKYAGIGAVGGAVLGGIGYAAAPGSDPDSIYTVFSALTGAVVFGLAGFTYGIRDDSRPSNLENVITRETN